MAEVTHKTVEEIEAIDEPGADAYRERDSSLGGSAGQASLSGGTV
jgi:hypothetical protein